MTPHQYGILLHYDSRLWYAQYLLHASISQFLPYASQNLRQTLGAPQTTFFLSPWRLLMPNQWIRLYRIDPYPPQLHRKYALDNRGSHTDQ